MSIIFPSDFEKQVFGPIGVVNLQEKIIEHRSVAAFMAATIDEMGRNTLFRKILSAAIAVEPVDPIPALADIHPRTANAYLNGAGLALGGLHAMTNPEQRQAMAQIDLGTRTEQTLQNEREIREYNAKVLMNLGHEGFERAAAYHEVFEQVEDKICPEARNIYVAKAGFGLPFYLLLGAIELETKKDFEKQISLVSNDASAWDSAIAELLGE